MFKVGFLFFNFILPKVLHIFPITFIYAPSAIWCDFMCLQFYVVPHNLDCIERLKNIMTSLTPDKDPWKPVFMTFFSVFVLPLTAAIWHARQNIWQQTSYFGTACSATARNGNALIPGASLPDREKVDNNHLWPDQTYCALPVFVRRMVKGVIRVPRHILLSSSSSSSSFCPSFYHRHPPFPPPPHHHLPPHHPHQHHRDNGKRVPTFRPLPSNNDMTQLDCVLNTALSCALIHQPALYSVYLLYVRELLR